MALALQVGGRLISAKKSNENVSSYFGAASKRRWVHFENFPKTTSMYENCTSMSAIVCKSFHKSSASGIMGVCWPAAGGIFFLRKVFFLEGVFFFWRFFSFFPLRFAVWTKCSARSKIKKPRPYQNPKPPQTENKT